MGRRDSALAGYRVLVTGAGGQVGGYLRSALEAAGATVVGLGAHARPGIDVVADVADESAIMEAVSSALPEVVIHAAAWTDVDGCENDPALAEAINAAGSRHVAEAARQVGAYVVAVGTDFVFDGEGGAPYAEDAPTNPISAYGRTKLAGEEAVLAVDPGFAVARTAWVYGGQGKHFPRTVLRILRDRGQMEVIADEAGSPTFAGDLAGGLVLLAEARGAGVFHLVNSGHATRYDLAREVAKLAGHDPDLISPVTAKSFLARYPLAARRPPDSTLVNVRAANLGIDLRAWKAALTDYVPRLSAEVVYQNQVSTSGV